MSLSEEQLVQRLLTIACDYVLMGPGYAQEGVVLRQARSDIRPRNLFEEQAILDAWQRLFTDGQLIWGHDLDNPRAPFFHLASQKAATPVGAR